MPVPAARMYAQSETPNRYVAPWRWYVKMRQLIAPQTAAAVRVTRSTIFPASDHADDALQNDLEPCRRAATNHPVEHADQDRDDQRGGDQCGQPGELGRAPPDSLGGGVVAADPGRQQVADAPCDGQVVSPEHEQQRAGEAADHCIHINSRNDRGGSEPDGAGCCYCSAARRFSHGVLQKRKNPAPGPGFRGNLLIGCNCAQWQNDTQMLFKSSSDPFQAFPLGPVGRHAVMVALMDTGAFQDVLAPLLPVCLPVPLHPRRPPRQLLVRHPAQPFSQALLVMLPALGVGLGPLQRHHIAVDLVPAPARPLPQAALLRHYLGDRPQRLRVELVDVARQALPGTGVVPRPVAGVDPAAEALLDEEADLGRAQCVAAIDGALMRVDRRQRHPVSPLALALSQLAEAGADPDQAVSDRHVVTGGQRRVQRVAEVLQRLRQRADGSLHQAGGQHVGATPVGVLAVGVRLVGHPPLLAQRGLVGRHRQH
ncbi:hypothetical protein G6F24_011948 [Rhizopus arrhizus]|nr:hypothetical protein G6F24_011948 [Rhizopus arrhizus]